MCFTDSHSMQLLFNAQMQQLDALVAIVHEKLRSRSATQQTLGSSNSSTCRDCISSSSSMKQRHSWHATFKAIHCASTDQHVVHRCSSISLQRYATTSCTVLASGLACNNVCCSQILLCVIIPHAACHDFLLSASFSDIQLSCFQCMHCVNFQL